MPSCFLSVLMIIFVVVGAAAAAPAAGGAWHEQQRNRWKYVALRTHQHRRSFHGGDGREVRGCKPRGIRPPPSAPSRYVNYDTLGSTMCGTARGRHHRP